VENVTDAIKSLEESVPNPEVSPAVLVAVMKSVENSLESGVKRFEKLEERADATRNNYEEARIHHVEFQAAQEVLRKDVHLMCEQLDALVGTDGALMKLSGRVDRTEDWQIKYTAYLKVFGALGAVLGSTAAALAASWDSVVFKLGG
jgi:hypothetical protein|tara:strand:+ start:1002 stop:1442 length:441 start_codon:yes stop_codon:yes gene_type:complete